MSHFIWLLFLGNNTLQEFFNDINIPFDCEFLVAQKEDSHVVLTEVYGISPSFPLNTYAFGRWSRSGGLRSTTTGFYERRNSLQGLTLRTAFQYEMLTPEDARFQTRKSTFGLFMSVWRKLENEMNFTSEYYTSSDRSYGFKNSDGSWTGVLGMLHRHEVEIANSDITMNAMRLDAVDYMMPLFTTRYHFVIREIDAFDINYGTFLIPFSPSLWFVVLSVGFLLSMCLTATYLFLNRHGIGDPEDCGFISCTLLVIGVFCQQGIGVSPKSEALRLIFLTSQLTALVLVASYSAFFISYLTLRTPTLPFTDFEGFYRDGSYRLSILYNSGDIEYFRNSTFKTLNLIHDKFLDARLDTFPRTEIEGLQRICSGNRLAHFMAAYDITSAIEKTNCSFVFIPQAFLPACIGFAIAKGSPYRDFFKYRLQIMLRDGLLNIWKGTDRQIRQNNAGAVKSYVTLRNVMPILGIFTFGLVMAVVIFVAEICAKQLYIRVNSRRNSERVKH